MIIILFYNNYILMIYKLFINFLIWIKIAALFSWIQFIVLLLYALDTKLMNCQSIEN